MAEQFGLQNVRVPLQCPECHTEMTVELDTITAKHKILSAPKPSFQARLRVIEEYKKIKGYDKLPNWDGANRGRAMKAAGSLLHFFRRLPDPVDVAIECLRDIEFKATRGNWPTWNLESVVKAAPDWLVEKAAKSGGGRGA